MAPIAVGDHITQQLYLTSTSAEIYVQETQWKFLNYKYCWFCKARKPLHLSLVDLIVQWSTGGWGVCDCTQSMFNPWVCMNLTSSPLFSCSSLLPTDMSSLYVCLFEGFSYTSLFGWLFQGMKYVKHVLGVYVCVFFSECWIAVWGEFEVISVCPGDLGVLTSVMSCLTLLMLNVFVLLLFSLHTLPQSFNPHHPSASFLIFPFAHLPSTIALFNFFIHSFLVSPSSSLFILHSYHPLSPGSSQSESSSLCRGVIMLRSCCSGNSGWTKRRQRSVGWKRRPWLHGTGKHLGTMTWQRVRKRRSLTWVPAQVTIKAQSPELTVRKVKQQDPSRFFVCFQV